jgi:TRAP-type C4-dicarboxylate transport system permease small subunit
MGVLFERVDRTQRRLTNIGLYFSALAIVILTILITFEVIARTLLNFSTLIADEMGSYLLAAATFLGLAVTLRQGGFIRIDTYRAKTRGHIRQALDLITYGLAAAYAVALDWYFWKFAWDSYRFGSRSMSIFKTPLWIPHTIMGVGGFLFLLEILTEGWGVIFRIAEYGRCQRKDDR